jgi:exodeoxyribonuclease VII large subunit
MEPEDAHLKLSDLTREIQAIVEGAFADRTFWVIADITNHTFKFSTSVHYFDLVEKDNNSSAISAKVACRAWGNASVKISNFEKITGQKFENNINVLVLVSVGFKSAYGLQLHLLDIDSTYTLGHFEKQRAATLERLVSANPDSIRKIGNVYYTKNKSLSFGSVLQRIALITSSTSAGYQDFMHILETNSPGYRYDVSPYFTLVQGEVNTKGFVRKLIEIFESGVPYDAVVIIRGGGAQTDFLLFDNYELSRAIAKFPIPIIIGIGHHKNESISDLMAHTSTNTPTKAAELLIAHNRMFEESVLNAQKEIIIRTQKIFSWHSNKLNSLKSHLASDVFGLLQGHQRSLINLSASITAFPRMILSGHLRVLTSMAISIEPNVSALIKAEQSNLVHYTSLVNSMSPQNILNKGFAILKVNGKIVNNADQVEPGTELRIQMAAQEITSVVTSKRTI